MFNIENIYSCNHQEIVIKAKIHAMNKIEWYASEKSI